MKKIYFSLISIVLTLALVTSTAYALFSSTASVKGITISTGSAGLKIWNGSQFVSEWNVASGLMNLSPGDTRTFIWQLKNDSTSGIGLDVEAQLIGYSGDWSDLSQLTLKAEGNSKIYDTTLSQWNSSPKSLGIIGAGETVPFVVTFSVPSSFDNSFAGKSLTDIQFDLHGLQVH